MSTKFIVWCPDLGQDKTDGRHIRATYPHDAATVWAEWKDRTSAEYSIGSGTDVTVKVCDVTSGAEYEMIVSGESVPQYRARLRIEPDPWPHPLGPLAGDGGE